MMFKMDVLLFSFFTFLLAVLICIYVFKRKSSIHRGTFLPGPKAVPAEITGGDMIETFEKLSYLAEEYGDIFKIDMYGKTMIYVNSTEALRKLFMTPPYSDAMNDRPPSFLMTHFYKNAESTIFNERGSDPIHRGLRRSLIRGLHVYGDGVKAFEDTVQNEIKAAMKTIESFNGEEFEFTTFVARSLANIISVLLIGSPFKQSSDADLFTRYTQSVGKLMDPSTNGALQMFPFLRYFPGHYKRICRNHDRLMDEILERFFYSQKRTYVPDKTRGLVDFFLVEQANDMERGNDVLYTDDRIITSIFDIVSAGNSTSRSILSSIFLCLLEYPEWQTKMQKEIDAVIGRDRLPSLDDRQACPIIEAVALEVQRYHNVTPLSLAHSCGKDVNYNGYTISEGSLIFPNLWHIHHDKNIWEDPWTFRPDRFLDQYGQLVDKEHTFRKNSITFGIGKRQCPAEMFARSRIFLYLSAFLQRWTFSPGLKYQRPSCDPRKGGYIIGMSSEPKPFYCKVKQRF